MSEHEIDEDNNPFLYQGIASRMVQSKVEEEDNPQEEPEESMLLYSSRKEGFNAIPINFESRISKLLRPGSKINIQISEAGNSNEGMANSQKKYVVYTIKLISEANPQEEISTRRRYSEFESLREVLTRIFPLVIIPPIPPKNYSSLNVLNGLVGPSVSPTSNTYINSTHLSKAKLVEHRKRLLTNFLNNCLEIPQIRNLDFFSKFLDPNSNWSDETALILSQLPKSIYASNPENGLKTDPAYAHMPIPSSILGKLAKSDDPGYGHSYIIDTSSLDETNKKIMTNYGGLSSDYTDLGTVLNSFSLLLADSKNKDDTKLNILLDKIGQSFDRSFITITALISDLETKFSEPLGEAVQYSSILTFISHYSAKKVRQISLVDTELDEKRGDLQALLRAEEECQRIEGVTNANAIAKNTVYDLQSNPDSNTLPLQGKNGTAPDQKVRRKFRFSFKKISQYVTDIMDQNPDETRKLKIARLQDKVATLQKCKEIMVQDISYIDAEVQKNFSAFHTKQLRDIYEILLCYNRFLIGWAKKNCDIWEEAKEELLRLYNN